MDIRAINAAHASMSRTNITMTEREWQGMTPAAQDEIHDIVTILRNPDIESDTLCRAADKALNGLRP